MALLIIGYNAASANFQKQEVQIDSAVKLNHLYFLLERNPAFQAVCLSGGIEIALGRGGKGR